MTFRLSNVVMISVMIATILLLSAHLHIQEVQRESFEKNGYATCENEECLACDETELAEKALR